MTADIYIGRKLIDALPTILDDAEYTIRLAVYQLSPPSSSDHAAMRLLWAAMQRASMRGVHCSAIIAAPSAFQPAQQAVQRSAQALANAGWAVAIAPDSRLMHAKCMIVDDVILLNGSHNWTAAGLLQNHEITTITKSPQAVMAAVQWHTDLYNKIKAGKVAQL